MAANYPATVDDLGPTLVFLCSEGSRFITGQLIAVDGGIGDVGCLAPSLVDRSMARDFDGFNGRVSL